MTWKEFKEQVEKQGVEDDMEVIYIDVDEERNKVHVNFIPGNQAFSIS